MITQSEDGERREDAARNKREVKRSMLLFPLVAVLAFVLHDAAPRGTDETVPARTNDVSVYNAEIRGFLARLDLRAAKLERAQSIAGYAHKYHISNRFAQDVYSAAERAGLDPELAFRIVKVESDFVETARSPVGAIGLTQLMLATAREYDESLTEEDLLDRRLNLRIGFRYLRALLEQYDGDVILALAAYNRGPGRVSILLAQGQRPRNDYERVILKGYTGRGFME